MILRNFDSCFKTLSSGEDIGNCTLFTPRFEACFATRVATYTSNLLH